MHHECTMNDESLIQEIDLSNNLIAEILNFLRQSFCVRI